MSIQQRIGCGLAIVLVATIQSARGADGRLNQDTLSQMGLGGLVTMGDAEAESVRGLGFKSSSAEANGSSTRTRRIVIRPAASTTRRAKTSRMPVSNTAPVTAAIGVAMATVEMETAIGVATATAETETAIGVAMAMAARAMATAETPRDATTTGIAEITAATRTLAAAVAVSSAAAEPSRFSPAAPRPPELTSRSFTSAAVYKPQ